MNESAPDTITGSIRAEPNPAPAETDSPIVLSWQTNAPDAEVSVSEDGAAEKVFSCRPHDSPSVEWIQPGTTYLFRLYATTPRRQLLDEVSVYRNLIGRLLIDSEESTSDGKIIVRWDITPPAIGEVCLSEDGVEEKVVCRGRSSSIEATGLKAGLDYLFRLYHATQARPLLDEIKFSKNVTGKLAVNSEQSTSDERTIVRWEISSPAVGELCLSEAGAEEKVVCRGRSGSVEVADLKPGVHYLFRLYHAISARRLLDEEAFLRPILGRISASPNPIPLEGGSKTMLQWEITPPATAEVCVAEEGKNERVVCRGASGSFEVSGLRSGIEYHFRLYPLHGSHELLSEVKVELSDIPWKSLMERLASRLDGSDDSDELADFIAAVMPHCIHRKEFARWYLLWEASGFHVTPVHFYEPIPDSRTLANKLWKKPLQLAGVEMNDAKQRHLLCDIFPIYQEEYQRIPLETSGEEGCFYLRNGRFEGLDPLLAYCMVRHFKPKQIIEVGSGYSTLILAQAARTNGFTELHSIEPYPEEFLNRGVPGLTSLLPKKVEEVDLSVFERLQSGDCLFIDTSHVVRIGGDVNFLFLEVLPRLSPGVIVHVHDVFFPFDYPESWVLERRRFWTEQYLLQAFLAFNRAFEVLVSSGYLKARFPEELRFVFPTAEPWQGGSFWMQRVPSDREAI